jgi:starch synthase (maltosyl-transferring)
MSHAIKMFPAPGDRLLRFSGDHVRFTLTSTLCPTPEKGWRAFLRTNLGRAAAARAEIIQACSGTLPLGGASLRDVPMSWKAGEWEVDLALAETGFFQAKACLVDARGRQHWPYGPDAGISVHPNAYRTANTIYCAFVRMFGPGKSRSQTDDPLFEDQLKALDRKGYTVIPPSGKFRDLLRELPHIFEQLNCRILHLLPVNPVPTTNARFGRFGSPYAAQDLTAIDPALVEFDKRATGVQQFCELAEAIHLRGGRLFLDLVINHTGWGSSLQENHPEWFLRHSDGTFVSPGAWGVVWEDLVELDHSNPAPWDYLADVFLTWCRRGVDGFRCDAGYKVPMPAWRYITARVRAEFPDTIFLLEGLGGAWEATQALLTEGGMQWAYSELFQNYDGKEVAQYLDYALEQSSRTGLYVHYSETHDNNRLAGLGRSWSLLRNRLCALTSVSGAFGFTCGVEWLATEKINVHSSRGLSWGSQDNLIEELARLNRLISNHPCFLDGALLTRLSPPDSPVYALRRDSAEGLDKMLVLVNTDLEQPHTFVLGQSLYADLDKPSIDLLGQSCAFLRNKSRDQVGVICPPGSVFCLSASISPRGLAGEAYREIRARVAAGLTALKSVLPLEEIGPYPWREFSALIDSNPALFLASLSNLQHPSPRGDLMAILSRATHAESYPKVVAWQQADLSRVFLCPHDHWLLIQDESRFSATLEFPGAPALRAESFRARGKQIAWFPSSMPPGEAILRINFFSASILTQTARIRFLPASPQHLPYQFVKGSSDLVLLTNRIGGMARLCLDLGRITSKYDCLLGANLHPSVPVDRHILAKRLRAWVNADHFISQLDEQNLHSFEPGPPARWRFLVNAGDGRTLLVQLEAGMLDWRNTTLLRFSRLAEKPPFGIQLSSECEVRLTIRVDIEDRNFHTETRRNGGADHHFFVHSQPLAGRPGFEFIPAEERTLRVWADKGEYHHEAEWSMNIPHPLEGTRGMTDTGDAYSPGWLDLPLPPGESRTLAVTADPEPPPSEEIAHFPELIQDLLEMEIRRIGIAPEDRFTARLATAARAFLVRRDSSKTVIAGYPWFLDWGRDTLICARGFLAAGCFEEVRELLITFGRFEENGTLPNNIHGEDARNRNTSDASLWFSLVAEEAARLLGEELYQLEINSEGRTLIEVLASIAENYAKGTPNGIRMDQGSGLIYSPTHFTWMDTNFPAGTPRAGYPIEIQALWIRLLRQLARLEQGARASRWTELARKANESLLGLFWIEEKGFFSDVLLAGQDQPAATAIQEDALRSNFLFPVSLGLVEGERARRCVETARKHLVVPGAMRSLAPLPVSPPLPVYGRDGTLLNNPDFPYIGRYEGDEDTRRKPAYHNGAAWLWTFPTFCEALALAWDFQPEAIASARSYLLSMEPFFNEGCLEQLPEILDGDAPHTPRGCDAQAWSVTETLRVWKLLSDPSAKATRPDPRAQ